MRFINCMAIATVVVFAASCGGNSSKEKETLTDTLATTSTTVPSTATFSVPDTVKNTFQVKYPGVQNVNWSRYQASDNTNTADNTSIEWDWSGWPAMDSSYYYAKFNMDNSDYWVWYDNQNNWVGTVTTVTEYNNLPAAVNKTVESSFPGYSITSVNKENDKDRTAYEIKLSKGDDRAKALISETGELMKKKSVVDGEKTKEKNL